MRSLDRVTEPELVGDPVEPVEHVPSRVVVAPATTAASCSGWLAPTIADVTTGLAITQAVAMVASGSPAAAARSDISCTAANDRSFP